MKAFVTQQINELIKTGLSMNEALNQLFKKYINEYELSNNNATKNEINKITDIIFNLKHPVKVK